MTPTDLLLRLRELDVRIWVEGEQLRFSPPDALSSELRTELAAREADVVRFLRSVAPAGTGAPAGAPGVQRVPRDQDLRLSFAQQRFWFLAQIGEENAAYHMTLALRLRGGLDVAALEWALGEIVRRHEVLRTTFQPAGDQPVQVIGTPDGFGLTQLDVSAAGDVEAAAMAATQSEFERPFDLTAGPLFRALLVRLSVDEHWLLATTHHIIADRWSYGVVCDELARLYGARVRGAAPELAELEVQYADFAAWQLDWYEQHRDELVSYWRSQLTGAPTLDLPTDRPRPPEQTFDGGKRAFVLPGATVERLKALGREERCTFFMAALAAFDVLLARYSGQEDVVVGTPIANRSRIESETMIGPFLNSLVLRTDLSGDPSFRELLGRVREMSIGAQQHQEMPFEQLVVELAPERDQSRNPLFQVMFNLLTEAPALALQGIEVEPIVPDTVAANFDLSLVLDEHDGGVTAVFQYNTDLFDSATIERMEQHFRLLLDGVTSDPDRCIWNHPMLTPDEQRRCLALPNRTERDYPRERCLHELVEQQAVRTPDAVAVVFDGHELTYAELNRRANRLAHHLRGLGAGPETLVGLSVRRSLDMPVAMLGVLKSGAAYVPIDPTYPRDRMAFILADAGVAMFVTEQVLLDDLPADLPQPVLLDADAEVIGTASADNPSVEGGPDSLAHVIFTSGSTGRPKGVQIEHRSLVNFVCAFREQPGLGPDDVVVGVSNIAFDLAGLDVYLALVVGARVVIASQDVVMDGPRLGDLLTECGATFMDATPATWQLLFESGWHGQASLKAAAGGDVVPRDLAERLAERCGEFWHCYGPCETTIYSTTHRFEPGGPLSIGATIANTELFVLDAHGQPVPIGVSGDIHIGGDGLARGYLGRPELTAEKFVPHPLSSDDDARLYRSGDVGRWLPDGTLESLGRADHQVKVRGFRIELGEIEHVLVEDANITECAVVAVEGTHGENQLVAHVVPQPGVELAVSQLREVVSAKLPDFMVPGSFAIHTELPLTPNGKVDRVALSKSGADAVRATAEYVAPRTPTEQLLAGVFAEVLDVDRVGSRDNFFGLGGHSLLAMRVVFRVEKELGNRFSPMELLQRDVESLATFIDARQGRGATTRRLEPVPRDQRLPLSPAQERFWFLSQLETDDAAYNVPIALRLHGALDVPALEWSLGEIVNRHEALRTSFAQANGQPTLVIADPAPLSLTVIDVSDRDDPLRESRRVVQEESRRPFDLSVGPLCRFQLIRLSVDEHVLQVTAHHAAMDEWSQGVLCRELAELYAARTADRPSSLGDLAVQYADFAVWQRRWCEEEAGSHLDYWTSQLRGLPALDLPLDRPRPAIQTFVGRTRTFAIPTPVADGLMALARAEGCTLFMAMLSAFDVLLARYSGQDDIVVGTPVANRASADTEPLIGLFLNTLVLRSDLSGTPSFRELLQRVRGMTIDAFRHGDLPFEELVAELRPERDLSRSPLFQVLFQVNEPPSPLALGEIEAEPFELEGVSAKFDLTFGVSDTADGLLASFEFNRDLFDDATIERMEEHLLLLLQGMVAQPNDSVFSLPLLTERERELLLVEKNKTARAYAKTRRAHGLFEEQVVRTPDRVALVCGDEQLTFSELNERANQLARHLQALGAGADKLIGISVERSPAMLIGLLGIWKAGAAYVPLDPSYPDDRLAFIIEDAGLDLLVTQDSLRDQLPSDLPQLVRLDADADAIAAHAGDNLGLPGDAHDLAYVIFTSGSTGRPKGVQIEHRALVNFLTSMQETPGLYQDDVLVAVTTISFDIAGLELYLPLLAGAVCVLAAGGTESDGVKLAELLEQSGATVMQATPATWQLLLEAGWRGSSRLKALCGGEALPRELAERLLPNCGELWNMYGPTETTIWSMVHKVESGPGQVSIGEPIENTQIYLLDKQRQPVPLGVPGELYLGGDGLARGYWNRPELTAEKFIAHPLSSDPSARLYATGDVARFRADGSIEFLGRIDHQVKIRGFRIELGEIEHVLAAHDAVAEAVVVAQQTAAGDAQLAAHVVLRPESDAATAELRDALRDALPEYMVPAAFAVHDELPLTPNGKVDRKALSESDAAAAGATEYEPPATDTERLVARVWQEVLGIDAAGRRDNFFDLGGHSLLAMKAVFRLESELGERMSPMELLLPDLAGFARSCEDRRTTSPAPPRRIEPVSRDQALALSPGQERFWFLSQIEVDKSAYNVPGALRLSGALDAEAVEWSLGEVVRRHEALRTTFGHREGVLGAVIADPGPVRLQVVDVSESSDPESEARRVVLQESHRPFDLTAGPLYRFHLLRFGSDDHVLLTTVHHAAMDEWSQGLLFAELAQLYAARAAGEASPLAELAVQYADYAYWQRKWHAEEASAQRDYWVQQLAGMPTLELPTDRARPSVQTFAGTAHSFAIPSAIAGPLVALGRREGCTVFMTVLAAFKMLLARYAREEDVVVGTPIANRGMPETEPLIGLFLNTLVLRTDLSGAPTFRELLRRVRDVSLGAFEHQDMPFEQLVIELRPERDLSRNPLFQVMFQTNELPASLALGDAEAEPFVMDRTSAKFDLTLSIADAGGDGLLASLEYNRDLFDATTIERMGRHLVLLVEAAAGNPDECVWSLPILTEAERENLLVERNRTAMEYPRDRQMHELIAERVRATPDAVAAVCGDERMTYGELDAAANRLAWYLRGRGAGPEKLVGISVERSLAMLVGLLGIWKSGAGYVPLDPGYPNDRLGFIIEDAGIELLVTQDSVRDELPSELPELVRLDGDAEAIAAESDEGLGEVGDAAGLAYVIFTSGSTGRPKGVQIEHRALVNFTTSMAERPGMSADDVLVAVTTISFDIAGLELFLPLLVGGRVVIAGDGVEADGRELAALLERCGATVMQATPATWQLLVESGWSGSDRLKVLCGGEALPRDLAERLLPCCGELWNMYGPTETTVWSMVERVESGSGQVAIGRPIGNTRVYMLDWYGYPVPVGVPGALCLGGDGLARGYLGRAGLTGEKFTPDDVSGGVGERVYDTGDLARWLDDGSIEFRGRADHQLKIRGFRIEPGEIEHVLSGHEAVAECVVVAQKRHAGLQLVAHVVLDRQATATVSELRRFLRGSLPEYMVPAGFVLAHDLPRTPNGKVDRKALRMAGEVETAGADQFVAPASEMERFIAGVWSEELGVEKVGVRDNFFDLGGHSLLAMKVAFRVEKEIGEWVAPMDMLVQSLGQFAGLCEKRQRRGKGKGGEKKGVSGGVGVGVGVGVEAVAEGSPKVGFFGRLKRMFARKG